MSTPVSALPPALSKSKALNKWKTSDLQIRFTQERY
jgi:hypothetical protein